MKDDVLTEAALDVCCTARICVANSSAASTISKYHDSQSGIRRLCPALRPMKLGHSGRNEVGGWWRDHGADGITTCDQSKLL